MGSTHSFCTSEAAAIASFRNLATAWTLATLHQQEIRQNSSLGGTSDSSSTPWYGSKFTRLSRAMRQKEHAIPHAWLQGGSQLRNKPTSKHPANGQTKQAVGPASNQASTQSVNQSLAISDLSVFQCASFTQKMLLRMVVLLCRRKCCPTRFTSMAKGGCDRLGNPLDLPSV